MASQEPLALDIETVGLDWDSLDEEVRSYLKDRAKTEQEREAVPDQLALNPGTGRIIAIGLWRPETGRGGVLVEGDEVEDPSWSSLNESTSIYEGSEEQILREFWKFIAQNPGRIITYNGRSFDGPFLMLRSAILDVEPTKNLMPYRFSFEIHCDLAEVVSFHNARGLESLDFWCHQMGMDSPKAQLDGSMIDQYYEEGKTDQIASYCLEDAKATAELFLKLKPIIELMDE